MMSVLSISFSASLLILAVVVMRAFFIHKLPKKAFLTLWLLALSRLLLPFSIPSRLNIGSIIEVLRATLRQEAVLPAPSPFVNAIEDTIAQTIPAHVGEAVWAEAIPAAINSGTDSAAGIMVAAPWYFWLWLAGFMICALFFIVTHLRCRSVYQTALPVENSFVQAWIKARPLRRKVRVKQSDKVTAPLAYGIWQPVILLPKDTNWQDEAQLSYILTHEYVHVRRFDAAWKWLLAVALAVHWFNPLVWLMYMLANRDLELSCDEAVLNKYGESSKSGYALTLINLAEKRKGLSPLVNNFSKNSVEERIVAIMKMKKTTIIGMLAAMIMVVGIAMIFATGKTIPSVLAAASGDIEEAGYVLESAVADNDDTAKSTENFSYYAERMLFATKGEHNVKVTYDGKTWATYLPILQEEYWSWYTYEEYEQFIESIKAEEFSASVGSVYPLSLITVDKDLQKLEQTLADIANGIKVSKYKPIYLVSGEGPLIEVVGVSSSKSMQTSWIMWYCFGYTFTDSAGNEVDLGLFETRGALFAALKQYYDKEVAAGRLTQAEAANLYSKIAHPIRNADEVSLKEKLLDYNQYSINCILSTYTWE